MRHICGMAMALCLLAAPAAQAAAIAPVKTTAPSGTYTVDKAHASLTFRVDHLGFSHYTARFTRFDATLNLDTKHPQHSQVEATIDPRSLAVNTPPEGFLDTLLGKEWLDTEKYPAITFKSTKVAMTSPNTARITGDFTLHGVTHPVTLTATFNAGYPGMSLDPHARVGFSAHGSFKRSQFGMGFGVPAPGSKIGVSDAVDVIIEAEFNGPDWKAPKAGTGQ